MAYAVTLQHSAQHGAVHTHVDEAAHRPLSFYLSVYVALAAASAIVGTLRFLWSFVMSLRASRALFKRILFTIMRTKLRWIDTVPVGRILNRLTADFEVIDNRITLDLGFLFWHLLCLFGVCVAALLVSMYILPLAVVLIFIAGIVGKRFLDGARPVKRLESTAKSPVFELFNAALAGVPLLRAFGKTHVYVERMHGLLDTWDMLSIYVWTMNRWLGLRMALFGTLFTTLVGAIVVGSSFVDAAMAGFTLSFALDFSGNMLYAIRGYASLELDMNAAERVIEYSELDTEDLAGDEPPAAWPTSGQMEVKELVAGYADDLPPVLKGILFKILNNERVGVIGRTGAGKSSLTLALFRFIEARSGTVLIDGLDISKINLHSLRSRLAIIPQVSSRRGLAIPSRLRTLTALFRTLFSFPAQSGATWIRSTTTATRSCESAFPECTWSIPSPPALPTSPRPRATQPRARRLYPKTSTSSKISTAASRNRAGTCPRASASFCALPGQSSPARKSWCSTKPRQP